MNENRTPFDFTAMGKEYLARADSIGEIVARLKREYKRTGDSLVKVQMDNWKEIEKDLRQQAIDFLRRGERRKKQRG